VHRKTGRLVALKNLEQQRFPTHKFLRELRFLLSLQHDNIVTCQALEHTSTGRYVVMDYCEGGTLRGLMSDEYRLNLSECLSLIEDVLAGLAHAHSRNIVHCDIKPENILLSLRLNGWRARISDFGIAKLSQELRSQDETGNTGSPAYMAPERFYGQYSTTSDVYSVGVMLYELLTGDRPFQGTPSELMSAHLNMPLNIPDSVPEVCRPIVTTALQKLSARRFRTAKEMLDALRKAMAQLDLSTSDQINTCTTHPLLRYVGRASVCNFSYNHATLLTHPLVGIQADADTPLELIGEPDPSQRVCYASDRQVNWAVMSTSAWNEGAEKLSQWQTATVPEVIQRMWLRPQGCFVQTAQSLHLIPILGMGPAHDALPQLIADVEQPVQVDVDPKGQWIAIASSGTVKFPPGNVYTPIDNGAPSKSQDDPTHVLHWMHAPLAGELSLPTQPTRLFKPGRHYTLQQLIALDTRHLVVLAHRKQDASDGQTTQGTLIELFTRRGTLLNSLVVPVHLGRTIPTSTPNRLLSIDGCNPNAVFVTDLKPYRIRRIGIEIQPYLMATTTWGYVIVDTEGQILMLSEYGDRIERISGPKGPTAITMPTPHVLLIATWHHNQGSLYQVNLKHLDIDLLF
jgi:serine/threonine-protein kinase